MKVVDGQLQVWGMASDLSRVSSSLASQTMREFINTQAELQSYTPDVLPTSVSIKPFIEADSGKLIDSIG